MQTLLVKGDMAKVGSSQIYFALKSNWDVMQFSGEPAA